MATVPDSIPVDPGTEEDATLVATYKITEESVKEVQRVAINDSEGAEVLGKIADAAQTDSTQTSSFLAFLKGLVKMVADVWDDSRHAWQFSDVNHRPGDDPDLDVVKVEQRYGYGTEVSADGSITNGVGFCHILFITCTTAGIVVLRDSLTAGGGTIIRTLNVPVGIFSLNMDVEFGTGLYADFDAGTFVGKINASKR